MPYHNKVLIVGGGNAGISVAARLRRRGIHSIGLIEPSEVHYYQPLWTLVGGGRAHQKESSRPQLKVIPKGVSWIKDSVTSVNPEAKIVHLASGESAHYEYLVLCPGIQLDWEAIDGLPEALLTPEVSSNYRFDLAPKTWDLIRRMRTGTAVFTMPQGPIKCGGAPQKIAYLAADYWRQQGVLKDIHIVLILPSPTIFGVDLFATELLKVADRYGIEVRYNNEAVQIDSVSKTVTVQNHVSHTREELHYDMLHVVPPQSAPDWLKSTTLSAPADPKGYIHIDPQTLRHQRYSDIFALGDAGSSPNSKTGAAIRKQAPVVVDNLLSSLRGSPPTARYSGYSSCPLTTARNKVLLAEFDYNGQPVSSIPLLNTARERRDMWILKRYGLPFMYWHFILKGRA